MSNSERYVPATELGLVLPTRSNGRSRVSRRMSDIVQFVSWIAQSCWRLTRTLSETAQHVNVHDVIHWDVGSINRQVLIGGRREGVPEANMYCVQCIETKIFFPCSSSPPCEPRPHLYHHKLISAVSPLLFSTTMVALKYSAVFVAFGLPICNSIDPPSAYMGIPDLNLNS